MPNTLQPGSRAGNVGARLGAQPGEKFVCLIGIGKHGNMGAHEQGFIGLMMGSLNGVLLSSLVAVEVSGTRTAEAVETEDEAL